MADVTPGARDRLLAREIFSRWYDEGNDALADFARALATARAEGRAEVWEAASKIAESFGGSLHDCASCNRDDYEHGEIHGRRDTRHGIAAALRDAAREEG